MKQLFLLAFFVVLLSADIHAGNSDTSYYRRPYYIGIGGNYKAMFNGILAGSPRPGISPGNSHNGNVMYWEGTYGVMVAFPFAKHWEWELGLEGAVHKAWITEISAVHRSPLTHEVIGYDYSSHYLYERLVHCRLQFAYEFYRKNNYALLGGIETWSGITSRAGTYFGLAGIEALVKSYIPVSHGNGAIQFSLIYGLSNPGSYVAVRAAFCIRGMRIYQHKPLKYYVRTYEPGE